MVSCYTRFMLKNVTVTLPEEVALWARMKAAEENTSVSRLLGGILEKQMRSSDEYWEAYQKWKQLQPVDLDAENRLSREAANGRG